MVFLDNSFNYSDYKGTKFETIAISKDEEAEYQIDYNNKLGMYRITKFLNNHWNGDIIFDEVERGPCDFCENILTQDEYFKLADFDKYDAIIKDTAKNEFYIYAANDDWYYNHSVVNNIKFCPKCGRRLK